MCISVSDFSRAAPLAKGMATWSRCCSTKVKLKDSSRCGSQGPRRRCYCRRSRRIDFSGAFTRDYRLVGDARSITWIVMAARIAPTTRCHDVASSCQLPPARLCSPLLAFCSPAGWPTAAASTCAGCSTRTVGPENWQQCAVGVYRTAFKVNSTIWNKPFM